MTETVIVLDFETTGLYPARGARAIEVAAVKLQAGQVVDQFQSLINAGVSVPSGIQSLTGITETMIRRAPSSRQVMAQLSAFLGESPLVAHNANFDQAFLEQEYALAGISHRSRFACTLKLARRVYPNAPDYSLAALLSYADIPYRGAFHRALADAMATAHLWLQIQHDLCAKHRLQRVGFEQCLTLANAPRSRMNRLIREWQ